MIGMAVNTKKVRDRRVIVLKTLDDLRVETKRLAAADRAGRLRRVGNWTTGQVLGHVAFWMNAAFDGMPGPSPPFLLRILGPIMVKPMLLWKMPAGVRLPGAEQGTYGVDMISTDEGERRLLAAIDRFERDTLPPRHQAFGRMSPAQWTRLHLNHAMLHFSFLHDV